MEQKFNESVVTSHYLYYGQYTALLKRKEQELLCVDELISIILYTDYSELSSHFTSSFRKRWAYESIQATINRHQHYYWMGKYLRNAVNKYGQEFESGDLCGPFYCGMSRVMPMPEFSMRLFSPTSTSCHIEVAIKFSGSEGLIIEFNNNRGIGTYLKGLDVSWISRFKEEDERYKNGALFCI